MPLVTKVSYYRCNVCGKLYPGSKKQAFECCDSYDKLDKSTQIVLDLAIWVCRSIHACPDKALSTYFNIEYEQYHLLPCSDECSSMTSSRLLEIIRERITKE
jgi:hypothetical protein